MAEYVPLRPYYKIGEIAEQYGLPEKQVLAWVKAGRLPSTLLLPGRAGYRICKEDLSILRLLRAGFLRDRVVEAQSREPLPRAAAEALAVCCPGRPPEPEPPPKRKRRPEPFEAVYFVECAGLIKIGYSGDLNRRLIDLQNMSGAPIELIGAILGTFKTERELHVRFDVDRQHGEWFTPSEGLRRGIAELLAERGIEISYVEPEVGDV